MQTYIKQLPSGFYGVWVIIDGINHLWDASCRTLEMAKLQEKYAKEFIKEEKI